MNWQLVSRLVPILGCCWLVSCDRIGRDRTPQQAEPAQSHSSTEQQPLKNPELSSVRDVKGEISVQIELGDPTEDPMLNFNEPIDVVLTNHTDRPLCIWSPYFRHGWYQLSFTFVNVRTGMSNTVRKQTYDTRHVPVRQKPYEEPDQKVIEIPPQEGYTIQVTFNQGLWGGSGWTGLPGPASPDRFSVTAQFESQESSSQNDYEIWTGKATSEPVGVRLTDPSVETASDALRKGYVEMAIQMMEENPVMIAGSQPDRRTALHEAAWFGHVEAVRWLLDHDADVNAIAYKDVTPLHMAVSPDVVRLILQKNPDLTMVSSGVTALQYAAEKLAQTVGTDEEQNWRDIVKLYVDAGAEVKFKTAIYLDDFERVKKILEKSPQLAVDDLNHQSPLRLAASLGRFQICRYLIDEHHVDVNEFERGNGYPIIKVSLAYPKIVELLIARGADLKTRISWRGGSTGIHIIGSDATALHYAAQDGVPETIRLLIDNGVDLFSVANHVGDDENRKHTALEVAAYFGTAENAAAIVNHSRFAAADPALRQADLDHSLFIGAYSPFVQQESGRLKFVRLLLEKGANVNTTENPDATEYEDEITVLEAAVHAIDPADKKKKTIIKDIADLLTAHGATMDLASAVAISDINQVRRLLKNTAELANARRPDGYPALHLAIEMNDKPIVKALLDSGCNIDIRNQAKYFCNLEGTGLHCAALWGRPELALLLIEAGADLNARDARRCTPLHEAAQMGDKRTTKLLLEHGADPNAENDDGKTPLDLCRQTEAKRAKEKERYVKEMEAVFREHQSRRGK